MPFLILNYLFKYYMPLVTAHNVVLEGNVLSRVYVSVHIFIYWQAGGWPSTERPFRFKVICCVQLFLDVTNGIWKQVRLEPYSKLLHFTNEDSKVMMKAPNASEISLSMKNDCRMFVLFLSMDINNKNMFFYEQSRASASDECCFHRTSN